MDEREIMIVAGEASGDLHAGGLVAELRRRHRGWRFFGCGGPRLQAAGAELLVEARQVAVVGLVEVAAHLPRIYRLHRRLRQAMRRRRPAAVILVDFPDFNLPLAAAAARWGIPVVYFISPQVWAWREKRVEAIRRTVRRMICIFPFEPAFYASHGIEVDYVGHPLVQAARPQLSREQFLSRHHLAADRPLIALLPGSRRREIGFNLPPMLAAAERLRQRVGAQFILPAAATVGSAWLARAIPAAQRTGIRVLEGEAYDALAHAEVAIVASGTATVEAALLRTPMVVVYRLSPYSYWLGRRWVRTSHFAMVNLVAEREIVPELIQGQFQPEAVVNWALKLLGGAVAGGKPTWPEPEKAAAVRAAMLQGYEEVRRRLQPPPLAVAAGADGPGPPAATPAPTSPWARAAGAVEAALEAQS
ncbi:MAG: lipid-A-disaccharide synthase [Terriglobales bacterium]